MRTTKALIAVAIVAVVAGSAGAANIYVDAAFCPAAGAGTVGSPYCTLASATGAAGAGDTILVATGTYAETLTPPTVANLTVQGSLTNRPKITGGAQLDNPAGDALTLRNLHFTGTPSGEGFVIAVGTPSANLTMENVLVDGENVAGQHGVGSGLITESLTVKNSEFRNILNWAVFESRSGSGGGGSPMTDVLFEGNFIHDSNGSVALRGAATDYTDSVIVRNNTWDNIGGNGGATGYQWAGIEVNRATSVEIYDNLTNDITEGVYGEGQCFQVWNITDLEIRDNCCTNTNEGVWLAIVGSGADGAVTTGGSMTGNTFINQTDWALQVSEGAPTDTEWDATGNYWGAADGPSGFGYPGSGGAIEDAGSPGAAPKAEADASGFLTTDVACDSAGVAATSTVALFVIGTLLLLGLSVTVLVMRRRSGRLAPAA